MLNQGKPQGCMLRSAVSGGLIAITSLVMLFADPRGAGAAVLLGNEVVSTFQQGQQQQQQEEERLGVIVPAYRGDLERAVSSLSRWPRKCSPVTLENVDLVLYYGEGQDDEDEDITLVTSATDTISKTAGSCFARTRAVYAHLSEEVREEDTMLRYRTTEAAVETYASFNVFPPRHARNTEYIAFAAIFSHPSTSSC